MQPKSKDTTSDPFDSRRLKFYSAIILIILILAVVVIFFPKGTRLEQCLGIFLVQNKDACLSSLAYSTQNQTICSYIQDPNSQTCYSNLAIALNSPAICSGAGSNLSIANCVSQIANETQNFQACNNLDGSYKDSCVLQVAISSQNLPLCSSISNGTSNTICTSIINLNLAARTSNLSYCSGVSDQVNRTIFSSVLSAVGSLFTDKNTSSLFSALSGYSFASQNYSSRDLCYILLASNSQNQTVCSFASSYAQGTCAYATKANNTLEAQNYSQLLSSCQSLSQYNVNCTQYVELAIAIATKNLTTCASLPLNVSYNCYSSIAIDQRNSTYCGYIKNATANNACLLQLRYSS